MATSRLRALALLDTRSLADTHEARAGRIKMAENVAEWGSGRVAEMMGPKLVAPAAYNAYSKVVAALRRVGLSGFRRTRVQPRLEGEPKHVAADGRGARLALDAHDLDGLARDAVPVAARVALGFRELAETLHAPHATTRVGR